MPSSVLSAVECLSWLCNTVRQVPICTMERVGTALIDTRVFVHGGKAGPGKHWLRQG